jgi:RNA polymerase sigma factor (sigma-70 family)
MSVAAWGVAGQESGRGTEVAVLYARHAGLVRGHVRGGVGAPEAVIEDACQVAWSRLLHHRDRVSHDRALAWVMTTAVREALKLVRHADREVSLDQMVEETGDLLVRWTAPSAGEAAEARLRLELLEALPERQQRLLWLQGVGFGYREIAAQTGATVRTVERQLGKARRRLAVMESGVD